MLNQLLPGLFVLTGTLIQMRLSLKEFAESRRDAIQHKIAEDELIAELSWFRRRQARRDFVRDRAPDVHRAIRDAWLHVFAWALLAAASVTAIFNIIIGD